MKFFAFLFMVNMAQAQKNFDAKGLDSLLFGTKIDFSHVLDMSIKGIDEIELGVFLIDGKISLTNEHSEFDKSIVKNIYCRRKEGEIATVYFVLKNADAFLTQKLQEIYGEPSQVLKDIIDTGVDQKKERNMTWRFADFSIYYLPSFGRQVKVLIINNETEATFFRNYKIK